MKKLFDTPKKAVISIICIVAAAAAIGTIAVKSMLIGKAEAERIALRDAGVSEAEASALRAKLEFDDGRFQYEVDFYNNGITYEYLIQGRDGDIIARDIDGGVNGGGYAQNQPSGPENQPVRDEGNAGVQTNPGNQPAADTNQSVPAQGISVEEAKAAALEDAGLSEADVTFKKAELDYDDGIQVYDIEFYTSDTEYDYEINAADRTVWGKSIEAFQMQADSAGNVAGNANGNYIGIDRAKEIALEHAGLNEADVQFAKAKLENDDGRVEYEIEFYFGRTEYDYTVDAVSGSIVEYDVDYN